MNRRRLCQLTAAILTSDLSNYYNIHLYTVVSSCDLPCGRSMYLKVTYVIFFLFIDLHNILYLECEIKMMMMMMMTLPLVVCCSW